jgi:hypothetical protein
MRGVEAFSKIDPKTRRVLSAALVTGVVAATGGFASVGVAASYFGMSTAKGLSAVFLGEITGKGIDKIRNFRAISRTAERRNLVKSLGNETNLEDFEKAEEAYRGYLVENAKKERKELVAKTIAMAVVGGAASMGLNHLSALYGPDSFHTASPEQPTPSPTPKGLPTERPSVTPSPSGTPNPTATPTPFPSPSPEATPTPRISPTPLETVKPVAPHEIAGPSSPDAHLEKLMTVRAGEGAWQPIYRQLEERLHDNPEKFNLTPEDLQNATKVRSILNTETMKILLKEKFINGDIEKRISMPGVKVLLGDNGAIRVFDGKPPEQLVYAFKRPTS